MVKEKEPNLASGEKEELEEKEKEKEFKLSPEEKIKLKIFALDSLARNQEDAAEACFRGLELTDEEIESLMELNLLGIEKEKEKLKEELKKIKEKKE